MGNMKVHLINKTNKVLRALCVVVVVSVTFVIGKDAFFSGKFAKTKRNL